MARTCTVDGCPNLHWARGWCQKHYSRWVRHGDTSTVRLIPAPSSCSIEGCDRSHSAKGLCQRHYYNLKFHGDPLYQAKTETPWNPWAYRIACPQCASNEWTMPVGHDRPSWRCVDCHLTFVPEAIA